MADKKPKKQKRSKFKRGKDLDPIDAPEVKPGRAERRRGPKGSNQ